MLPGKALSLISSFLHVSPSARSNSPATTGANEPSSPFAGATRDGEVTAVVFSKDRPGQLLACLLSLLDKLQGLAQVRVIWTGSNPQSRLRYAAVKERLHSERLRILWFKEDDANGFSPTLQQCLSTLPSTCKFILFQVDDAIHYRSLNLHDCCALLRSRGDILNVHLKLWSNVTVCNPAGNKGMTVPPIVKTFQLIKRDSVGEDSNVSELMIFERSRGTLDWNYPFDLSGGLYRRDAIEQLLQHLLKSPKTIISTPNRFEVEGNKHLVALSTVLQPLSACLDVPAMSIVTINRVQDEFDNPVFRDDSTTNKDGRIQSSPPWERLTDVIFERGMDLDSYKSASASFNSCHIGELLLNDLPDPEVSVLIPCRNAEATLRRALESVMEDIHQTTPHISVEIVVVDDASTDASPFIALQIKHREDQKPEGTALKIRIVACARSSGSVADCLDEGLRSCRGRYIIRMDADDISLPGRILAQLQIMRERPGLGVLGTRTWIITPEGGKREASTPIGPASLAWSLFFYCPLVHPSVCIRRDLVFVASDSKNDLQKDMETISGYHTNATSSSWKNNHFANTDNEIVSVRSDVRWEAAIEDSRMEDYLLWHRILDQGRAAMDNAPIFGLELHQHHRSVTASWRKNELQKEQRDLEQARIALHYAQRRSGALQSVTDRLWMIICRGRVTNETDRLDLIQGIHFVQQGLDELRESIEREFKECLSVGGKIDLEFVVRDCEARKLELAAICGAFHSSATS